MQTGLHRGYFGIGVQEISKEQNVGTIMRSAHAFGASFFFSVAPVVDIRKFQQSDTAKSAPHLPYYEYPTIADLQLPKHCALVGVELVEGSIELPSFRHPAQAAYILGPEAGSLHPEIIARCDHIVRIPMSFCVNVGVAAAIIMYDRTISRGRFPERPVSAGGEASPLPDHVQVSRKNVGGEGIL